MSGIDRLIDNCWWYMPARIRQVDRQCWWWLFTFGKVEWECVVVGSVDAIDNTAGSRYTA